ncbi:DUF1493 family protein [Foetidibacter luteolus]|uniref:DUF1493 family protein n=1 Tax=Foetidibacter luteolus TaxID=2608880 RepID=UPI00129B5723|nr:DUF1493 family protein [Foetidibacter luteolus]
MIPTVLYGEFKTLRQAYIEVKSFVETEVGGEVFSLKTKIEDDLGCAGDDNYELLEKFVTKYKLDTTGFDYSKHFLWEGELFGSGVAFWMLLSLPIVLVHWLVKMLTFGKVDWTNKQLLPDWNRETMDMTFGDMLTWYLTGKYSLRKDVIVRLTKTL